jgi:hypothetical protein
MEALGSISSGLKGRNLNPRLDKTVGEKHFIINSFCKGERVR